MDKVRSETVAMRKHGPKTQPRRKALISMTAAEYEEFDSWADESGMTKAMLMHDMMGRERERRMKLEGSKVLSGE